MGELRPLIPVMVVAADLDLIFKENITIAPKTSFTLYEYKGRGIFYQYFVEVEAKLYTDPEVGITIDGEELFGKWDSPPELVYANLCDPFPRVEGLPYLSYANRRTGKYLFNFYSTRGFPFNSSFKIEVENLNTTDPMTLVMGSVWVRRM